MTSSSDPQSERGLDAMLIVPAKGLPRVLYQVHQWLNQTHPQAAEDFWSRTGGGSHLP
jgi:hypothetical protein